MFQPPTFHLTRVAAKLRLPACPVITGPINIIASQGWAG
jgi:hypothetical protein